MRKLALFLILLLACAASVASADDPFLSGEALSAQVAAKCAQGCVVFNREEAAEMERQVNAILARRQQEAFKAGVQYQAQACRSLI